MGKKRILLIDDDKDFTDTLTVMLSSAGYETFASTNGKNVFEIVNKTVPDLILLDVLMPDTDGLEVKTRLNGNPSTKGIPVIFLTAKDSVGDKVSGLNLGADDYVTKPFETKELLARIEAVLKKKVYYEEISMTDGLTGLYNVNFFKQQFTLFFNIAKRYNKKFSLAIIDINNFKHINDTYGHLAGDFVLKTFSSVAKDVLRRSDIISRYGGDEFAVIMPETDDTQAGIAIERLKSNIDGKAFYFKEMDIELEFSISAGIAVYEKDFTDEARMFELADRRFYEEKTKARSPHNKTGKNI